MAKSACSAALAVVQDKWGRVGNGSNRVIRGGSFNNDAVNMRAAKRNNNTPGNRNANNGGRCLSPVHRPPSSGSRSGDLSTRQWPWTRAPEPGRGQPPRPGRNRKAGVRGEG